MKTLDFKLENFLLGLEYNDIEIDFDKGDYQKKIKDFMKELNELESKYQFNLTHFAYSNSEGDEESQLLLEDTRLEITIGEIFEKE